MRARHKKKMLKKSARYTGLRKGNMEKLWHFRQSMWRNGERVYTWENSSPAMREKIIEENRNFEVEDRDWWDSVYEDADNVGITITGFDDYRAEGKLTHYSAMDCIDHILAEHGDTCDTYKTAAKFKELIVADQIKMRCLDDPDWEEENEDLRDDFLKAILKDYRRMLSEEYEYLTSDDCLEELFKGSDYEFDSEGRIL
jgi:hypothetical protein